jgi:ABC-type transport system involved in cytochrome c biogenesis permease component
MKLLLALSAAISSCCSPGGGLERHWLFSVLVLLPIGIGADQVTLQRLAPGFYHILLPLLSADRIFQQV